MLENPVRSWLAGFLATARWRPTRPSQSALSSAACATRSGGQGTIEQILIIGVIVIVLFVLLVAIKDQIYALAVAFWLKVGEWLGP